MDYRDELRDYVTAAAAFLDEKEPEWWRDSNTEWLELSSCENCVLGQLGQMRYEELVADERRVWGKSGKSPYSVVLDVYEVEDGFAQEYGFDLPDEALT